MSINKSLALALTLFTLSASTAAAEDLTGKVSEVFVSSDGTVTADLAGDPLGNLNLCSVTTLTRSVTKEACTAVFNMMMAAKLSGIPVVLSGTKAQIGTGTSYNVTLGYAKFAN